MLRRLLSSLLLLTIMALAPAAAGEARPHARYRVQQDVLLTEVDDWRGRRVQLGVDVYLPGRPRAPLLVWLHGGAFVTGSRREGETLARNLAARGYAVASIDYRLRTPAAIARSGIDPALADASDDLVTAVAWVQENAATLGVDPRRIAIGGHSAGAFTALSAAASAASIRRFGTRPCLVVSVGGGIEVAKLGSGTPPVAFFHAAADAVAPRGFAFAAYDALRSRGTRTWWVDLPGDSHTPSVDVYADVVAPRLAGFLRAACGR